MFDVCEIDREPKLAIGLSVRAAVHGQQREFAAIAKTASRRRNAGENRQVELIRNGLRRAHPGVECLSQERDAETNDQADDGPRAASNATFGLTWWAVEASCTTLADFGCTSLSWISFCWTLINPDSCERSADALTPTRFAPTMCRLISAICRLTPLIPFDIRNTSRGALALKRPSIGIRERDRLAGMTVGDGDGKDVGFRICGNRRVGQELARRRKARCGTYGGGRDLAGVSQRRLGREVTRLSLCGGAGRTGSELSRRFDEHP